MELPIGNVYQQSARDERSTQWGPFNYFKFVSANETDITVGGPPGEAEPWIAPDGYVASIKGFMITAVPGNAQKILQASFHILDDAGNVILVPWTIPDPLADDEILVTIQQTDLLLIIPKHFVQATFVFDGDSNSNIVQMSVQAVLMPKGNISLF